MIQTEFSFLFFTDLKVEACINNLFVFIVSKLLHCFSANNNDNRLRVGDKQRKKPKRETRQHTTDCLAGNENLLFKI